MPHTGRDRAGLRRAAAAALHVPLALLLSGAGDAPEEPADLVDFVARAEQAQKRDIAAWRSFGFRRLHTKTHLDEQGRARATHSFESMVRPAAEGFDEQLLKLDGRDPAPGEVNRHRKEAKFTRHYEALLAGDAEDDEEGAYSLGVLFRLATYTYAGRELVDDVLCHRLDFRPDPSKEVDGLAGRFAGAMEGSLWVSVEGLHLLRARARTIRPISIALNLSRVHELVVGLDGHQVAPGVYLPRSIEVTTRARVLIMSIRQRNEYRYSGFTPAGGNDR